MAAKVTGSLLDAGYRKSGKTSMLSTGFPTLEKPGTYEESFTYQQIFIEHHYVPEIIQALGTDKYAK